MSNEHQARALKNHCRFAFETNNPKLCYLTLVGSVVLSVNSRWDFEANQWTRI